MSNLTADGLLVFEDCTERSCLSILLFLFQPQQLGLELSKSQLSAFDCSLKLIAAVAKCPLSFSVKLDLPDCFLMRIQFCAG